MAYKDRERSLYHGFFTEINLYLNDYQPANDWLGVMIFTQRGLDPGLPQHYQEYAHNPRLHRIYLDRLPQDLADRSIELGVLQLIGLKPKQAPDRARALLEQAQTQATDANQQQRLVELIVTTIAYKFPDLTPEEVQQMLGLNELKQTRFYQEAQREGVEQGIEQGIEQGREQMLSRTVPVLLRAGLSIDQIAQQLQVEVEAVRRAADSTQN
jgi:predicted transposase/invertase (TIGR01784 family)